MTDNVSVHAWAWLGQRQGRSRHAALDWFLSPVRLNQHPAGLASTIGGNGRYRPRTDRQRRHAQRARTTNNHRYRRRSRPDGEPSDRVTIVKSTGTQSPARCTRTGVEDRVCVIVPSGFTNVVDEAASSEDTCTGCPYAASPSGWQEVAREQAATRARTVWDDATNEG